MGKQRRVFTPDFKFQIVLELLTGEKRAAQLCREHRISETSLSWCDSSSWSAVPGCSKTVAGQGLRRSGLPS